MDLSNPNDEQRTRDQNDMITYAERVCFTAGHIEMLHYVESCVARIAASWGNELRCHELARAVQRVIAHKMYELIVVDGKCGPIEHSWLCFSDGVILDPYVPGRLPAVQMIDPIVGTAYRSGAQRRDIQHAIIDRLVLEMRDNVTSVPVPPARPLARD